MIGAKVLLVDDSYTVIRIITSFLEEEGCQVFSTMNSSETLQMVYQVSPDIILLDIIMPGIDGFEVCRLLKQDPRVSDIPVIILTAETDSRDIIKAVELGATDYIRKPAERVEVTARIQSAYKVKQYQEKLKEMAIRDGLTGLYNHAYLIGQLESTYSGQAINGGSIAVGMVDIDLFKQINDTYGHMAGDSILREVSCILSWSVGEHGIVGRYGGEEFGIVILDMPEGDVCVLCESVRKNIEKYEFCSGETKIPVTISMGVCFRKASTNVTYDELLKKADDAMYVAKRSGRNRVEMSRT